MTLATAASAQTVSLTSTAGPITLGANIGNATDSLTLITGAGDIVGGAGTATANNLTLNAAGGIGIGTAVNTNTTGTLSLTTAGAGAAGNITVLEAGLLNLTGVTTDGATTQTVDLTGATGVQISGAVGTAGPPRDNFLLTATAGNIVNNGGTVTANNLTLSAAAGGIGTNPVRIATAVSGTLTLMAGAGGAFVDNTGSVTLAAPVLGANAPITVTSTGTLTLPAVAFSTGTGSIDFESNGGTLATAGTLTTTTGNITLVGSAGLTAGHALTSGSGAISLTGGPVGGATVNSGIVVDAGSGTIAINGGGSTIQLNDSTLTTTNAGATAVSIQNATTVALGNVTALNGTLQLGVANVSGAVTQNGVTAVKANTLTASTSANVTLNNAANDFVSVGTVALGAGTLTLVDGFGGLTVNGAVTANGGVNIQTSGGALAVSNLPGTVAANAGNIVLRSTDSSVTLAGVLNANALVQLDAGGLAGVINQTGGSITAASLIARAPGNVTLTQAANDVVNLAGSSTGGTFSYRDANAVTVNTVNDASPVPVPVVGIMTTNQDMTVLGGSGNVAINAAVDAGNGIVRLENTTGNITQTAAITAGSLLANALGGSVSLGAVTNNVTTSLAGQARGANGSFRFLNAGALNVDVIAADAITTAGNGIVTNNGDVALQTGGTLTLNQAINASNGAPNSAPGSGTIRLRTTVGDITQAATGAVIANGLLVDSAGAVTLTAAGTLNDAQTLAGRALIGAFSYQDSNNLTVTNLTADGAGLGPVLAIGPISGVSAVTTTTLTSGATLTVDRVISGATVNLFATTDIIENAAGGVVTPNLQAVATNGVVNLTAGAANNNTGTIAGNANGDFSYTDNNSPALTIGTVTTVGVTSTAGVVSVIANAGALTVSNAVQAAGNVTLTSNGNQILGATVNSTSGDIAATSTNGTLDVNAAVTATSPGGDVTLLSLNDLSVNAAVSANAANGIASLRSMNGTVVEPLAGVGVITANSLLARAAVNVDLFKVNAIGAGGVAGQATAGFFVLQNNAGIQADTVLGVAGITSGTATMLRAQTGDVTQAAGAAGRITTGAVGFAALTVNGNIFLTDSNAVTGNFTGTAALGNVTFRNATAINMGLVSATSASAGVLAGNGITSAIGAANFVALTADAGAITQDAVAGARILGSDLRLTTTNGNAILTNAANEIVSVGVVALGAGRLTLVDSTGGLTVNGGVTANGGVNIVTTGGALSVSAAPGSVTANAGDIILRSTDSSVTLAGVLTAGGLVQLDASGAGVIDQTGGGITGTSLIARAPGNIALTLGTNDVTNLAGASTGGTFRYRDTTGVAVATVADSAAVNVIGLTTTNQDISVVGGAGDVAINAVVNSGTGIARLQNTTGNITQTAAITAGSLLANALGGSVSLGAVTNNVMTSLAGQAGGANGSFRFLNAGALNVDAITADAITTAGNGIVTNNGDVALQTGGALTLNQAINAANGAPNSAPGSGTIRLRTTTGNIAQIATGAVIGNGLLVDSAGAVTLTVAGGANDVRTLAGRAIAGAFSYRDVNDVTVNSVSADGGGLGPVLPIGPITSIATPGLLTLVSGGVLNLAVPITAIGSLDATAVTIDINGGGVTTIQTSGGQTYNSPVVLTADTVLTDTGSSTIQFLSTVDSDIVTPRALTVNTSGSTLFGDGGADNVGLTQPLASLTTDAGGTTVFNILGGAQTVRTTGAQTYNDAVRLAQDTVLVSSGSGNIAFNSTLDSVAIATPRALTVNTIGNTVFGDGIGADYVGGMAELSALTTDAGGSTVINITPSALPNQISITTRTTQNYGENVVLNNDTVLNGTTLTFGGSLTAVGGAWNLDMRANPGTLSLSLVNVGSVGLGAADVTVNGALTGVGALTVAARTLGLGSGITGGSDAPIPLVATPCIFLNADVTTIGFQTYFDCVTLVTNVTMTSTGAGNIQLTSMVDSQTIGSERALTVNTAGLTLFGDGVGNDFVGGTVKLLSLTTDAPGSTVFNILNSTILTPSVSTTTTQTYGDAVTLMQDTVFSSTGAGVLGNIAFNATVDTDAGALANRVLTVNTSGNTLFGDGGADNVGLARALASMTTDAGGSTVFNITGGAQTVLTTGAQTYNDAVTLMQDTVLTSNASGAIAFSSTVDTDALAAAVRALTVNTSGNTLFGDGGADNVGLARALASVTTDAGGSTVFNIAGGAQSVLTTGAQTYNDAVTLMQDTVLTSNVSGNIAFNATVDTDALAAAVRVLTVNTSGNTLFGDGGSDNVGLARALASVTTDAGGSTVFNITGGAQTVLTTGAQTYNDAVTLMQDTVLTSSAIGSIAFNATVDTDAGALANRALTVNTSGNTFFGDGGADNVGLARALASVTTDAGGSTVFNITGGAQTVLTTGTQTYSDAVTLMQDTVLTSSVSGAIEFNSTLNTDAGAAANRALTVNTAGSTLFGDGGADNVGAIRALASVLTNAGGSTVFNIAGGAQSVQTSGTQTYHDAVTLMQDTVLSSTGAGAVGAIAFNSTVNTDALAAANRALTVNTAGSTLFGDGGADHVGLARALASLTTDAGGSTVFNVVGGAQSVQTSGKQTYNDAVTLVQDTVLSSTGVAAAGEIAFNATVNTDAGAGANRALKVNTAGATIFGDGGADNVGAARALASLLTNAGGTTVFNIAGGTQTVLTSGTQTYNDAVTLTLDTVLASTGAGAAGNVTFNGTVNGPRGLTANTAGATTFSQNVGLTSALASLGTDAPGTTVLPAVVLTSGSQNYADPVTLTADTFLVSGGAGAINLLSTVNAANKALTLSTQGSARLGATISNLASLTPSVFGTTTIGTALTATDITVPGPLRFTGPVAVEGNVSINTTTRGTTSQIVTTGATLRFDKTVEGPGSLTASSGGVLVFADTVGASTPLNSLSAIAPIITLNSARTQNLLKVDALTTVATSTDGSDGLLNLIGGSYSSIGGSVQFNPTKRSLVSKHATILSTAGNVFISAAGDFFMGNEQKMLINGGSLTILVGGIATLGDMAAATSMNVTAGAVVLQGRPSNGFFNSNRKDHGLGFVSPTIRFNAGSIGFAPGTTPAVVFSTRDSVASVRQIPGMSLEIDANIANQFSKQDLKLDSLTFLPVVPNVIFGTVQPIASGTRVTEPGQIQVTFVLEIPKLVELPQDTFLSKGDKDILERMGLYPRDATPDENITVSLRRGVYRQPIEGKAEMDDPDYQVVINRLTTEEVQEIIKAYQLVAGEDFSRIDKIATLLDEQVKKFHEMVPGSAGLEGFTAWLQTQRGTDKQAEEMAQDLDELSGVFIRLSRIGLTKKEVKICKMKICYALNKGNMDVIEIAALVEGAAKLPPLAPRPAVTSPPSDPAPVPSTPLLPSPEPEGTPPGGAAPEPPPAAPPAEAKAQ
ncbi:MAG: hypothetical protein ABIP85_14115 [Chthoniobacteraceae bacterium]